MSEEIEISKRTAVYRLPGMEQVDIRRDLEFSAADGGSLAMDVYRPRGSRAQDRLPAVVFVSGYPDPGFEVRVGCKFKEMGAYVSWAQLTAASGLAAIVYTNREPADDVHALLRHVRENSAALGVDEARIGIWACSGNVPTALSVLMRESGDLPKCAVLCYGFMLDHGESAAVADASARFGFANPSAGKTLDDLPRDLPLFVARAGLEENPGLNSTIDRFVEGALGRNLPLTFVNHAAAPHAFDLMHDSETSREIIRQILAFMRLHLIA